jgi:Vitamin K epoxide reductase family
MTAINSPWAWRSSAKWLHAARLALSGAGAVMVFYLVYVELFRVDAICLWCTAVHLTTIVLFGVILAARASLVPDAPRSVAASSGTARKGHTGHTGRAGRAGGTGGTGARGRRTTSLTP